MLKFKYLYKNKSILNAFRGANKKLNRYFDLSKNINVVIVPGKSVAFRGNNFGFGAFSTENFGYGIPFIGIAGIRPERDIKNWEWQYMLMSTLVHELIHWKQYLNNEPLVEDGVEEKTEEIMRKLNEI